MDVGKYVSASGDFPALSFGSHDCGFNESPTFGKATHR